MQDPCLLCLTPVNCDPVLPSDSCGMLASGLPFDLLLARGSGFISCFYTPRPTSLPPSVYSKARLLLSTLRRPGGTPLSHDEHRSFLMTEWGSHGTENDIGILLDFLTSEAQCSFVLRVDEYKTTGHESPSWIKSVQSSC
jgi:hypothetical protein